MTYIPAEAEFGLLRSLYLNFSCTTQVPVSTFPLPVITTKQAVKEFWYKASLPPCHPSWWRMNPSNLTHIYYMVLGPTSQPPKWHLDRFSHFCIHCSKDPNAFQWGRQLPKLPLTLGDLDTIKYVVSWAHLSQPAQKDILISSISFLHMLSMCPTHRHTHRPS